MPPTKTKLFLIADKLRNNLVLGEGLEPPQPFRTSGLQPDAIAATRTQHVCNSSRFEPTLGFEPRTFTLQKCCSTTELSRQFRIYNKFDFIR